MESSILDFVAQACMDLSEAIGSVESEVERENLITNHIKKVSSVVLPVEDFKKSMF